MAEWEQTQWVNPETSFAGHFSVASGFSRAREEWTFGISFSNSLCLSFLLCWRIKAKLKNPRRPGRQLSRLQGAGCHGATGGTLWPYPRDQETIIHSAVMYFEFLGPQLDFVTNLKKIAHHKDVFGGKWVVRDEKSHKVCPHAKGK